ncbi:unnamed protein product [Heligmosomoides polygyrus]|uniref:Uncharacterized protein n=1 Tax=Heligmosomoides polygyrus TaxID=6339 RepID=A0A183GHH2_HELPZ|nr:unnamed protein product [Heligmosomoides polygyrus]
MAWKLASKKSKKNLTDEGVEDAVPLESLCKVDKQSKTFLPLRMPFAPIVEENTSKQNRLADIRDCLCNAVISVELFEIDLLQPENAEGCKRISTSTYESDQIYHCIGPLHPEEDNQDNADKSTSWTPLKLLRRDWATFKTETESPYCYINPYAQAFKIMRKVELAEEEVARRERRPPQRLKMVFEESKGEDSSGGRMIFQLRMKLLMFM